MWSYTLLIEMSAHSLTFQSHLGLADVILWGSLHPLFMEGTKYSGIGEHLLSLCLQSLLQPYGLD